MKKTTFIAALLGATIMLPAVASAAVGYTDQRATMRAGPGNDFPRIERIPANLRVNVHGCIDRFAWCDVSFRGERGWIDGDQLRIPYQGRRVRMLDYGARVNVPLISFRLDTYWDNNYRGRTFYRDRDRWSRSWSSAGGYGDRDRDGIPNRFEDRDRDGRPNAFDRDRDGDGTPNWRDDRPNNPRRD